LYGGKEQFHFAVEKTALKDLIYSADVMFVDLDVAGQNIQAILQDAQFHPLTEEVIHVDFFQLDQNKPLVMQIPVKLTGTSPGVKMGGKLVQKLRKLRVKALTKDMPQYVEVSIEPLEVGKSVRVRDLKFDKFEITNTPEDTIVSVTTSRALRQAEQEAAGKK
jgi:large subunit ribosomal protein L25